VSSIRGLNEAKLCLKFAATDYFFLAGFFFSRFGASLFPMATVSHTMQSLATDL
jgi:hypothetical protein